MMLGLRLDRFGKLKGVVLCLGGLTGLGGCGAGGGGQSNGKTVYSSPEEVDKKKADLYDAMKGGAYGSAGRSAAPQLDPTRK